jgi:type I restriction enzyme S subunit
VKTGWKTESLSEVCSFSSGLWKGKKPPFRTVGVIRNTNFNRDGSLDDSDIAILDVEEAQFAKRSLSFGDIILEKSGGGPKQPVGRVIVFDKQEGDYSFSNFTARIRSNNPQVLNPTYLHRFLYWIYAAGITEGMQSHSTGIRNLDLNAYKNLGLFYPSLKEQERIVAILDESFEAIATAKANTETNVQNAGSLFSDYLQSKFSDVWQKSRLVKLSDLASDITDGDHLPPPKSAKGVPFVTISNINKQSHTIDFSDTFFVSHEYFEKLKPNKKPRKGDLLYTVTGSFGIPVKVEEDFEFCFQRHIGLIRPKPDVSTSWLYYLMLSPQLFQQANERATGTAQRTVSLAVLRDFSVPKLKLSDQQLMASKLDKLKMEAERLEAVFGRKLSSLEALKQSLLHQAFTGKL